LHGASDSLLLLNMLNVIGIDFLSGYYLGRTTAIISLSSSDKMHPSELLLDSLTLLISFKMLVFASWKDLPFIIRSDLRTLVRFLGYSDFASWDFVSIISYGEFSEADITDFLCPFVAIFWAFCLSLFAANFRFC